MAAREELTDDECAVLDRLYAEGCWGEESFSVLRPDGSDASVVPRLRRAVGSLLERGLVEIRQTRDFDPHPPGRLLSGPDAAAALEDDRAWATLDEDPDVDPDAAYFVVIPRRAAIDAYWRARDGGR